MDNTTKRVKIYGAGRIGTPSIGADVGGQAGPAASSSGNRGVSVVQSQAAAPTTATGISKGSGTFVKPLVDLTNGPRNNRSLDDFDDEEEVSDASSSSSRCSLSPGAARRSRRPPTMDEYLGLTKIKAFIEVCRKKEKARRRLQKYNRIRQLPIPDLIALMLKNADEMERLASCKNLSGKFKVLDRLRENARILHLVALEGTQRTKKDECISESKDARGKLIGLKRKHYTLKKPTQSSVAMDVDSRRGVSPASYLTVREGVSPFVERNSLAKANSQPVDIRPAVADFDLEVLLTIFKNKLNFTSGGAHSAPQTILEDDAGKKSNIEVERRSAVQPQLHRQSSSSALTPKRAKKKGKRKKVLPSSSAIEAASHAPTEKEGNWAANKISAHVPPKKGDRKTAVTGKSKGKERVPLPKTPRTSAVVITIPPKCNKTYCEVMNRARERIHLEDIGIDHVRPRRVKTGGLLLELTGPNREKEADKLAYWLKRVLRKIGVQVSRPMKRVELRVRDLEESVEQVEVQLEISEQGGCLVEDIDCGELRSTPNGLCSMWVRCPLTAARKILAVGRLRVDWYSVRVELLRPRPLQCYRCLEYGHVQQRCTADVDRSQRCYRCAENGHKAAHCSATTLKCPLCTDLGLLAGHRLGSLACQQITSKGLKRKRPKKPNTRPI